jgi:cytochrome P450
MRARPRPADLSRSFSLMVPASVICALLGVPIAAIDRFHEWSNAIFADWTRSRDTMDEAWASMSRYMSELIALKRKIPEDDLISVLIDARDFGDKLSEGELVQFCIQLLAAGHETTANSINMSFVALCQHPDELARGRG